MTNYTGTGRNLSAKETTAISRQLATVHEGFEWDRFGDTIYVKDGRGNGRVPYPVEAVLSAAKRKGFY